MAKLLLLKCVHVHKVQDNERYFTIYCDNNFHSRAYRGPHGGIKSSRFSGVVYTHPVTNKKHLGQVVAIILYKIQNAVNSFKNELKFLVARFKKPTPENVKEKRDCPLLHVRYDLARGQPQVDAISYLNICGPLFIVPALDFGMCMGDVGCVRKNDFYVLQEDVVSCNYIMSYDMYLSKNDTSLCYRLSKSEDARDYLNYNPYMTCDDLNDLKERLNVHETCDDSESQGNVEEDIEENSYYAVNGEDEFSDLSFDD